MRQISLFFPFSLALFIALFGTALFPHIKFTAFAPFLALLYNKKSFSSSLWISALCGLSLDLLSSERLLGLYALSYSLTTLLAFKQKRHFFEDKPLALSLFTLLISVISTLCQILLISIFDRSLPLSGKLFLTDIILMPMVDALYAFLWFSCPMMLYLHIQRVGWRAFLKKWSQYMRFHKES